MDSFSTGGHWCMCRAFSLGYLNVFHYGMRRWYKYMQPSTSAVPHLSIFRLQNLMQGESVRHLFFDHISVLSWLTGNPRDFAFLEVAWWKQNWFVKMENVKWYSCYGWQQWPLEKGTHGGHFHSLGRFGRKSTGNRQHTSPLAWPDISTQISTRILL